jgi:DNA polymerase I-like protein with 3'-5' exonuclease and polymerase domains
MYAAAKIHFFLIFNFNINLYHSVLTCIKVKVDNLRTNARMEPARYCYHWILSGRMSCGGPNNQQMPRANNFRVCFSDSKGNKLVITDYSQIELRVVAEISKDERMIYYCKTQTCI